MVCVNCGRELEEVFKITDSESDLLQYAISRENLGKTALYPKNFLKHKFQSPREVYSYIKNSLDTLSEGEFLRNNWEFTIRNKYQYLDDSEGMIILDGIVYKHKQEDTKWVINQN